MAPKITFTLRITVPYLVSTSLAGCFSFSSFFFFSFFSIFTSFFSVFISFFSLSFLSFFFFSFLSFLLFLCSFSFFWKITKHIDKGAILLEHLNNYFRHLTATK